MKMLASTAVRLPVHVMKTIGKIMNSKHPDLYTGQTEFENYGAAATKMLWVGSIAMRIELSLDFI